MSLTGPEVQGGLPTNVGGKAAWIVPGGWDRVRYSSDGDDGHGWTFDAGDTRRDFGKQAEESVVRIDFFSSDNGVPEPRMWMMLLSGFGLVGAAMRQRNRKVRLC